MVQKFKKLTMLLFVAATMLTFASCNKDDVPPENPENPDGHEYVDLGLPSGTKWATCNIGASSPEQYGDYYAWGETTTKEVYDWSTYMCNSNQCGTEADLIYAAGLMDIAGTQYDAATANWGEGWKMPTYDQMRELWDSCTWTLSQRGDVNGCTVTGSNGNSIFLPCVGYREGSGLDYAGSCGDYWSSTRYEDYAGLAWYLSFDDVSRGMYRGRRYYGKSVRPVHE